jgi:hypothetical protein
LARMSTVRQIQDPESLAKDKRNCAQPTQKVKSWVGTQEIIEKKGSREK